LNIVGRSSTYITKCSPVVGDTCTNKEYYIDNK
jgi:hypothetical protein